MPRPSRCRRICSEPEYKIFSPCDGQEHDTVLLTVDEFETIRLVDFEKRTHEDCATLMAVSRTTVTEIYERARSKLAECLVGGKRLQITGGNYRLCDGSMKTCCRRKCRKKPQHFKIRGGTIMKIAVTYENGQIFQHFGHTPGFKIYTVEDTTVTHAEVVGTGESGHGALAGLLQAQGVDALICGGIGGGAQTALANAGIKLYGGVSGGADEAVNALLAGKLDFDPAVHCDHHGHEHHGECGADKNGCHGHEGCHD